MSDSSSSIDQNLLTRLKDYQRVLGSFTRIASEALPLGRLLQHATAQAARVTHIRRAKVMRYRREQSDLLLEAGVGWDPGVVGHATLGVDHRSPPGRAIQTAGPIAIESLPDAPEYDHSGLLQDHGVISLLNVPIMVDGRTWGVLEVDTEHRTTFDDVDIEFLATLANVIGNAIARQEAEQKAITAEGERLREQAEADMAMQELQHRTKNNLQVITGMLSVKRRQVEGAEAREVLDSMIRRVEAVALAHDMLSTRKQPSDVEFSEYLRTLCASIEPNQRGIRIEVEAESALIPLNRAAPAALIVNELVTNSIKYAFGNEGGTIRIRFWIAHQFGEACLSVEDDGIGIKKPPERGLGLKLVEGFARQIGGQVHYLDVEKGSHTKVCFPVVL
jgi:two-component sensor histidine kinase